MAADHRPSRHYIATDFRYYEQVGLECPDFELVKVTTRFADALPELAAKTGVRRLAFEADHATLCRRAGLGEGRAGCRVGADQVRRDGLRSVKDASELATMSAAIVLADEALADGLAQVQPGMTERELAWIIESYMRTHGARIRGVRLDRRVWSERRPTSRPGQRCSAGGRRADRDRHGGPGQRLSLRPDPHDLLGQPNDPARFWEIYNTVLRAQVAAEAAIRPGLNGQDVDAVARNLIAEAGYGDTFGHGLGHGVGLAIHEEPRLSRPHSKFLRRTPGYGRTRYLFARVGRCADRGRGACHREWCRGAHPSPKGADHHVIVCTKLFMLGEAQRASVHWRREKMARQSSNTRPWLAALLALIAGLIVGLIIGWGIWPVTYKNTLPQDLRPAERDHYLGMVAVVGRDRRTRRRRLNACSVADRGAWPGFGEPAGAAGRHGPREGCC